MLKLVSTGKYPGKYRYPKLKVFALDEITRQPKTSRIIQEHVATVYLDSRDQCTDLKNKA